MAEAQVLEAKVGEEAIDQPIYDPSPKVKEVIADTFAKFTGSARDRDQAFEYFDGRGLIKWIDDSVRRFTTNKDVRDEIEDWQAQVFDPFTRNKVIAILGKVAGSTPTLDFIPVQGTDITRASLLGDLAKHADYADDQEELMFYALLEAAVKGTVVGYEGYSEVRRKVRNVVSYDGAVELDVEEKEQIERKVVGSIVPLEEFYPSSVGIRKIKDMPYCFWRTEKTFSEFASSFAGYPNAKFVRPFAVMKSDAVNRPFYQDYISSNTNEGTVEIIRYFNQLTDEFIILANGVWLNPVGTEKVMPIPFNHKRLPFWKAIYEPLGADFFYGKSLPDKLKSMQDVINVLHNMLLDQSFLSIFPPLLVDANDDIEDDFLRPGRRIPVDDPNKFKELQISAPQGFHQYILEYTKRILEETSVDSVNQGMAGGGDRTTATEIERAARSVAEVLGLFSKFIKWARRDQGRLRAPNILQFYNKPLIQKVLGDGSFEEYQGAFNTIRMDDTILTSGKRGTKIIEMYKDRKAMPTRESLRADAKMMELKSGGRVEKMAVNAEYIKDFEFDIRLVPSNEAEMSKALQRALVLEKAKVYMEYMPEFIDKQELAVEIAEAYDDDPRRILKPELFQGEEQNPNILEGVPLDQRQLQLRPQMRAGGGAPSMGITENMMNAATGGNMGGESVAKMMNTK